VPPTPRTPNPSTRVPRGRFLAMATLFSGIVGLAALVPTAPSSGNPAEPATLDAASERCRKAPLLRPVRLDAPYVYLDAVPTGDTLLVSSANSHYPWGDTASVTPANLPDSTHGQTVVLEGAVGPGVLEDVMVTGDTMVVVWWGYDAGCQPEPFWGSALNLDDDDMSSLVVGTLRDSADWHQGLPVVDVHSPGWQPFPGGAPIPPAERANAASASHLLDLYRQLPIRSPVSFFGAHSEAERQVFHGWANASPGVRNAFPVRDWLRDHTPDT
jgi:hypothetical protein